MVARRLPNEILVKIAEETVNNENQEQTKGYRQGLWTLCKVNRLFCYETRKGLFRKVTISYSNLERDTKFYGTDHIAVNIQVLTLIFDTDRHENYKIRGVYNIIENNMAPDLCQALRSTAKLQRIRVVIAKHTTDCGFFCLDSFYKTLRSALSDTVLPHLEELEISDADLEVSSILWELEDSSDALLQTWGNLKYLSYTGTENFEVSVDGIFLREFFVWILGMKQLKSLFIDNVRFVGVSPRHLAQLVPSYSSQLTFIYLSKFYCGGQISEFLHAIRYGPLQQLNLEGCYLEPSGGRWEAVFLACLDLPALNELVLVSVSYARAHIGDYHSCELRETCNRPFFCTPFEEDKVALRLLGEAWLSRNYSMNKGWKVCTGFHGGLWEEIPKISSSEPCIVGGSMDAVGEAVIGNQD